MLLFIKVYSSLRIGGWRRALIYMRKSRSTRILSFLFLGRVAASLYLDVIDAFGPVSRSRLLDLKSLVEGFDFKKLKNFRHDLKIS